MCEIKQINKEEVIFLQQNATYSLVEFIDIFKKSLGYGGQQVLSPIVLSNGKIMFTFNVINTNKPLSKILLEQNGLMQGNSK